jgi:hypothetical protein
MIEKDRDRLWAQLWRITEHTENLGPTNKKKQHTLIKSRNQPSRQKLLSMIVLVGDEIQHRVIKSRRGWDMVEQLQ